jgi:hypothetical protein
MNDDFLKAYAERPNPQFAEGLRRRLNGQAQRSRRLRALRSAFAGLVLVLVVAFGASPSVRAAANRIVRQIGGLTVIQSQEMPVLVTPGAPLETQKLPVVDAVARFSGNFKLPADLPDGYELEELGEYAGPPESKQELLLLHWSQPADPTARRITLLLRCCASQKVSLSMLVADASAVDVLIAGQPGLLALGTWNADTQQFEPGSLIQLHWQGQGGTLQSLIAARSEVSAEMLLVIAKSMQ